MRIKVSGIGDLSRREIEIADLSKNRWSGNASWRAASNPAFRAPAAGLMIGSHQCLQVLFRKLSLGIVRKGLPQQAGRQSIFGRSPSCQDVELLPGRDDPPGGLAQFVRRDVPAGNQSENLGGFFVEIG